MNLARSKIPKDTSSSPNKAVEGRKGTKTSSTSLASIIPDKINSSSMSTSEVSSSTDSFIVSNAQAVVVHQNRTDYDFIESILKEEVDRMNLKLENLHADNAEIEVLRVLQYYCRHPPEDEVTITSYVNQLTSRFRINKFIPGTCECALTIVKELNSSGNALRENLRKIGAHPSLPDLLASHKKWKISRDVLSKAICAEGKELTKFDSVLNLLPGLPTSQLIGLLNTLNINMNTFHPLSFECLLSKAQELGRDDLAKELVARGADPQLPSLLREKRPSPSHFQLYAAIMDKNANGEYLMVEEHVKPSFGDYHAPEGCSFMQLPHRNRSAKFPHIGSEPLFIRSFYQFFYDFTLNKCRASSSNIQYPGAIVSGNAGIGKSAFGVYVLIRACREKRRVVYFEGKNATNPKATVFPADGTINISTFSELQQRPDLFDDSDTLLIFDSCFPPFRTCAFCLVISFPKQESWSECLKWFLNTPFIFPNWSVNELIALHFGPASVKGISAPFYTRENDALVISFLTKKEDIIKRVISNYQESGGLARYVQHPSLFIEISSPKVGNLSDSISKLPSRSILNYDAILNEDAIHTPLALIPSFMDQEKAKVILVGRGTDADEDSPLLDVLGLSRSQINDYLGKLSAPFSIWSVDFVSQHICRSLTELMSRHPIDALHGFLDVFYNPNADSQLQLGAFSGNCLAAAFIKLFPSSNTLKMFDLVTQSDVSISPKDCDTIDIHADDVLIPHMLDTDKSIFFTVNKNYPAIDAAFWTGTTLYLFQCTTKVTHEVLYESSSKNDRGLKKFANFIGHGSKELHHVWVIPRKLKDYYSLEKSRLQMKASSQLIKERIRFYHLYFDDFVKEGFK